MHPFLPAPPPPPNHTHTCIHSTLPAHDLVTLSQTAAFITGTPMVLAVHVPMNLLMLDSASSLMLMGFSRLKRVQNIFPTKTSPMMLGPYGSQLPTPKVNTHKVARNSHSAPLSNCTSFLSLSPPDTTTTYSALALFQGPGKPSIYL